MEKKLNAGEMTYGWVLCVAVVAAVLYGSLTIHSDNKTSESMKSVAGTQANQQFFDNDEVVLLKKQLMYLEDSLEYNKRLKVEEKEKLPLELTDESLESEIIWVKARIDQLSR